MNANITEEIMEFKKIRNELTSFMMTYKFALEEVNTKINILQQEFSYIHDYNPIEHVKSRIKSPSSILKKMKRKQIDFSLHSIKENIRDIAGIRIICSFVSDIYEISNMLEKQKDIMVVEKKDYIKNPKQNGYRSLHLIIKIPIFMSDREEHVYVEIQIRTIAMDFWASLEHKIYYKYNKEVPQHICKELKEAAMTATIMDEKMENLHTEMNKIKENNQVEDNLSELNIDKEQFFLPADLIKGFLTEKI
jgi:putative GTP pyrophosphokinase